LPDELVAEIVERTDGVPLFLEELTKAVLESGQLRPTADAYVPETPLADIAIPASLHESLVARLDRPASGKRVAQTAACIGREFDHELLAAVAEMPETALRAALEELVAAELVFRRGTPPEAAYAFKHALVRDAAYDSLLKTQRQALHGRIVQALRERFPQRVRAQPEVVAHHCSVAGLAASAAELWLEAGLRAKARYANAEAAQRLRNCQRELPRVTAADPQAPTGATREMGLVCLTALGDLAGLAGELDAANGFYRDALGFAADAAAATRLRNKMHRPAVAFRDGTELAYYEHGSGARTLLFANPLTYGLAVFQPLLERLCQEFRVITVDCRGTGRSAPLSRPYLMREHVEDLRVVIEAAGPPVVGVGISRSGNQLLRLARARPDLLEALVTVDMPLGSADPPPPLRYPEVYLERRWALLREGRVEDLVRLQAEYILGQPGERDVAKLWIANCLRLPRETVLSFFDPDPDMDVTGILRSVRTPTLVMHGSADCLNPLAVARHVAAEMPDARLYVFEGRGHLPVLTAPDEFCEVLRRFVLAERRGRERTATRPTLSRESPGQPKGKEPAPRDASALTDQPDE
jgi:pimeloyl-ACP methyl ester carboxylesterase